MDALTNELQRMGWLGESMQEHSFTQSTGVRILAKEVAERNPRLREPLYLYALLTGQIELLQKSVLGTALAAAYEGPPDDSSEIEKQLRAEPSGLPEACRRVWHSYLVYKKFGKRDEETNELMRQQIVHLQSERGVSNYRLYTSLGLNPGDLNAWLKHGDGKKVSLKTACAVLEQVRAYH